MEPVQLGNQSRLQLTLLPGLRGPALGSSRVIFGPAAVERKELLGPFGSLQRDNGHAALARAPPGAQVRDPTGASPWLPRPQADKLPSAAGREAPSGATPWPSGRRPSKPPRLQAERPLSAEVPIRTPAAPYPPGFPPHRGPALPAGRAAPASTGPDGSASGCGSGCGWGL